MAGALPDIRETLTQALSAARALPGRAPALLAGLPAQAIACARAVPARLRTDRNALASAVAGAAGVLALLALMLFGDPSKAYAVARIELPAMPRTATSAPPLGVDSPTASRPPPRPVLRAASDDHGGHELALADPHGAEQGGVLDPRAASPTQGRDHAAAAGDSYGGLAPAPIEALARTGPGGLLPRIAASGQTPAAAYARPYADESGAPMIAVVVGGLGLNAAATREAIDALPADVTLSFVPYTEGLQGWIDAARAAGHEVILELPMEPYDYPANDPGPHTLLARADQLENDRRLEWLMSRGTGYFAVMNYLGARFTAEPAALAPVLEAIAEAGVAFLYDGETRRADLERQAVQAGLDLASADRILDAQPNASAIDEQLLHLEALAMQKGDAIGAGFGYPVTLRQVRAWAATLPPKGYRLAPVSAVLARRAESSRLSLADAGVAPPPTAPSFTTVPASFGAGGTSAGGGSQGGSGGGSTSGGHH